MTGRGGANAFAELAFRRKVKDVLTDEKNGFAGRVNEGLSIQHRHQHAMADLAEAVGANGFGMPKVVAEAGSLPLADIAGDGMATEAAKQLALLTGGNPVVPAAAKGATNRKRNKSDRIHGV